MKNIFVLPSLEKSKIYKNLLTNKLFILQNSVTDVSECNREYQNIYITNSEEIKENTQTIKQGLNGDYFYNTIYNFVSRIGDITPYDFKIILTTNPELIKNGVQAIDDYFLECFIAKANDSGKAIDIVEVEEIYNQEKNACVDKCNYGCHSFFECINVDENDVSKTYKPIIPQPKQETIEEVAEREAEIRYPVLTHRNPSDSPYILSKETFKHGVRFGAKHQSEKMFSKQELLEQLNILIKMRSSELDTFTDENDLVTEKWFDKFKKH